MAISPISPIATASSYSPQTDLSPSEKQNLPDAVAAINHVAEFGDGNELRIVTDEATRRTTIQIVNRDTREVIRQIPPRYVLRMAAELRQQLRHADQFSNSSSLSKRTI